MSESSVSPATGDSSAPVRPTLSDMRNFLEQMQEYGHGLDEWHLTREAMERVLKLAIKAEEAAIVMRLSDLSKRCAPSEIVDNCCPLCGPASAPSATPRSAAADLGKLVEGWQAEEDAVNRDAARYRWLRDVADTWVVGPIVGDPSTFNDYAPGEMDALIDEARK